MRSVADRLKAEERAALAALTPAERVALALALGARDLEAFSAWRTCRRSRQRTPRASSSGVGNRAAVLPDASRS